MEDVVKALHLFPLCLDTLPAFENRFSSVEIDMINIVKAARLTGTFPKSLKSAVVKPRLKKQATQY